jgi:hypothetical protein
MIIGYRLNKTNILASWQVITCRVKEKLLEIQTQSNRIYMYSVVWRSWTFYAESVATEVTSSIDTGALYRARHCLCHEGEGLRLKMA